MISSSTALAAAASSQEAHDATAVKPAADVSVPTTPASDKDTQEVEKPAQKEGWNFFNYILFIAIVAAIGLALWWTGAPQALKRYLSSRTGRGKYRRVYDLEK